MWRVLGLIQLLVLTVQLCISPFSSLHLEESESAGKTTFKTASGLRDTLPFAIEDKVRAKTCSIAPSTEAVLVELPAPARRPLEFVFGIPKAPPLLTGFQLRVCERPPPSCL